ncbi:hypothetical protein SH1V18_24710 [Vallitalea longa]|uniref:SCP domain-containing protein n=1 Tax=Vallitalea longa TaxID=2936439 RepID=A0A9W5YC79_9FIRM|nr:CAP domain-containing protein [Vallitalea longa]GKX29991.1 hypothetical protein SH1V18_24710 [Vallitalea longa]
MKKISVILIFTLFASVMFTSCRSNEEPVKGIESSVNQTGQMQAVKITADNCKVTVGCDPNSSVLQTCNKDTTLNVLSEINKDWVAVKLDNNQIGFVPQKQCTPVLPDSALNKGNQASQGNNVQTPSGGKGNQNTTKKNGYDNLLKTPPTRDNPNIMQQTPNDTTTQQQTPGTDTTTPPENNNVETDTDNNNTTTNQNISNEEQQLVKLINQSRQQNGLKPLVADNQLSEVARIKSKDMIDNNYFSHNSPTYGDPFKMLKDFGIQYLSAAENIAGNKSVEEAHEALMNSPGHRKNILNPEFTHIGIGIQKGSKYGYMFTELFMKK